MFIKLEVYYSCKMSDVKFRIAQLFISTHFNVSATIGSLLHELNVSLLVKWRGEQTVPHVTKDRREEVELKALHECGYPKWIIREVREKPQSKE